MSSWDERNDEAAESHDHGSSFRARWDSVAGPGWPDNPSSDRILIARRRSVLASYTARGSLPPCSLSSRASFGSASGYLLASCKAVSSTASSLR
jgi:hypothetical protein